MRRLFRAGLRAIGPAIMRSFVLAARIFVPSERVLMDALESRIYSDLYAHMRLMPAHERDDFAESQRRLLWSALGADRAESLLSRIERRVAWEQRAMGLRLVADNDKQRAEG